jgi:hypothetical protein
MNFLEKVDVNKIKIKTENRNLIQQTKMKSNDGNMYESKPNKNNVCSYPRL